jgi:predicted kinase
MAKLIVGIGVPGSGKSTLLKKMAGSHGYAYLSTDDIRKELTGNIEDQSRNREVWEEAKKRLKEKLQEDKPVVFDATFTVVEERRNFLDFARANGARKIQGIFLDTPPEVAKERNRTRDRQVPEYVIDKMSDRLRYSPPKPEDGFDAVFTFDEFEHLKEAERWGETGIDSREFKVR